MNQINATQLQRDAGNGGEKDCSLFTHTRTEREKTKRVYFLYMLLTPTHFADCVNAFQVQYQIKA